MLCQNPRAKRASYCGDESASVGETGKIGRSAGLDA